MARRGRPPGTKATRRITFQMRRDHAELIAAWAEDGGMSQSEALTMMLDHVWDTVNALTLAIEREELA